MKEGEFSLPFVNLLLKYQDWLVVPFMGVKLRHEDNEYVTPIWKVIRKSIYDKESGSHHLWGGMNGEIILNKSWGDVLVRTTMARRGSQDEETLLAMMDYEVPVTEHTLAGDLTAPGRVIFWRVGPSLQPGTLNVVLARKCKSASKFDKWVSFSSHYPGNVENREDVGHAVQDVNRLVECLRN